MILFKKLWQKNAKSFIVNKIEKRSHPRVIYFYFSNVVDTLVQTTNKCLRKEWIRMVILPRSRGMNIRPDRNMSSKYCFFFYSCAAHRDKNERYLNSEALPMLIS